MRTKFAVVPFLLITIGVACGALSARPSPGGRVHPQRRPVVTETPDLISVRFPGAQVEVTFGRGAGGAPVRFDSLTVNGRPVLLASETATSETAHLELVTSGQVGGIWSWPLYLILRWLNGGEWVPVGGRESFEWSLDESVYLGHSFEGASVVLRTEVDGAGALDWILTPLEAPLGERVFRGLGWQVRVEGLIGATHLRLMEPAVPAPGDWAFQQVWGDWIESRFGTEPPFEVPPGVLGADQQPFYFSGGKSGATAAFFARPSATQLAVYEQGERHLIEMRVPLGDGELRATPLRVLLSSDAALESKWRTLDQWTATYDEVAALHLEVAGLQPSEPLPTVDSLIMPEAPDHAGWLDRVADEILPAIAGLGFRSLVVVPWETDADHLGEFLPGSESFGSANAPWGLEISKVMGGERALGRVLDRAGQLGVEVLIWTSPGHLSNSSPLLVQNPDWLLWRRDGRPEDADYRDIVGTSLFGPYLDYAAERYQELGTAFGYAGYHVDSFLTFGILEDGALPQPQSQLGRTLELISHWQQTGVEQIHIEGCGPFGVSSGGYGYEGYLFGGPADREVALEKHGHILGREYGLYRFHADTLFEPESYYRALASKGQIIPIGLEVLEDMSQELLDVISQANHDYNQVLPEMGRRQLLGQGEDWHGVAWSADGSPATVLFAFDSFPVPVPGRTQVDDITIGSSWVTDQGFVTEGLHTYRLSPY